MSVLKVVILCVLYVCISVQAAGLYDKTSNVVQLTPDNFAEVLVTPHVWMVEFYAPWCGHCKNLAPAWETAATNLKGIAKIAAINCDEYRDLCGTFGIKGFPTIKFFPSEQSPNPHQKGAPWKNPEDYNGERSASGIVDFVSRKLPSFVETNLDSFFADNELNKVILFTDKAKTTPLYKGLSIEFKNRLKLAQIQHTNEKYVNQYEITSFPTLLVETINGEKQKYSGPLKAESLIKFLEPFAKPLKQQQTGKTSKQSEQQAAPVEDLPTISLVENQADFEKLCLSKSGNCIVAVLGSDSFEENLVVATEVAENYKKQFRFLYILGPNHPNFLNEMHIDTSFPQYFALNPSKKTFSQFVGTFSTQKLSGFLDKILGGTNKRNTQVLSSIPSLDY